MVMPLPPLTLAELPVLFAFNPDMSLGIAVRCILMSFEFESLETLVLVSTSDRLQTETKQGAKR